MVGMHPDVETTCLDASDVGMHLDIGIHRDVGMHLIDMHTHADIGMHVVAIYVVSQHKNRGHSN